MEPLTISLIISAVLNAFFIIRKIIKRVNKSSCIIEHDNITYKIDISKVNDEIDKTDILSDEEKQKVKKALEKIKSSIKK